MCYPLLARWFMPLASRHKTLIVGALVVIEFVLLAFLGGNDYNRTALYVFPPMRIIDFIIGMTLATACPKMKKLPVLGKSENGTDIELISIALLSLVVMLYRSFSGLLPWGDVMLWWLPVALILTACFIYDKREGFIGKFLSSKPMQWLGNISFEIYMLQGIAALVFNYLVAPLLGHIGFGHPSPFDTATSTDLFSTDPYTLIAWFILPIDILLAWLVNRLFTRPLRRLLSK
jgi:peptidoglycan/LPS O-acetylase OafA/YrhL